MIGIDKSKVNVLKWYNAHSGNRFSDSLINIEGIGDMYLSEVYKGWSVAYDPAEEMDIVEIEGLGRSELENRLNKGEGDCHEESEEENSWLVAA